MIATKITASDAIAPNGARALDEIGPCLPCALICSVVLHGRRPGSVTRPESRRPRPPSPCPWSSSEPAGRGPVPARSSRQRVASVSSSGSPSSRVASCTRAATLTGSPITPNSVSSPPPIVPTSTRPELIPIPIRQRSPKCDSTAASMSAAAASARSAWSGRGSGRRRRRAARLPAACSRGRRAPSGSARPRRRTRSGRRPPRARWSGRAKRREAADVDEQHRDHRPLGLDARRSSRRSPALRSHSETRARAASSPRRLPRSSAPSASRSTSSRSRAAKRSSVRAASYLRR